MALAPGEFAQLLPGARAGDAAAVGRLLDSCRSDLHRVARGLLPHLLQPKGSGSDLVQDTLLAAVRHLGDFRGGTEIEFRTWLESILRNEAADFRRRFLGTAKRRATVEVPLQGGDVESSEDLASGDESPRTRLIARETRQRAREVLAALPANLREIVEGRIFENLSFAEIGRRIGRSESTVRHHFGKAVRLLAGRLGDLR
jgi:RNA polymerase sigma-70 factor (ECF subfamily)